VRQLLDAESPLKPSCSRASSDSFRVGQRPASADGLPIVGPLGSMPNVIVATGHYRNGILLAPLTAVMVARHVFEGLKAWGSKA
jgi:glycine oxidase